MRFCVGRQELRNGNLATPTCVRQADSVLLPFLFSLPSSPRARCMSAPVGRWDRRKLVHSANLILPLGVFGGARARCQLNQAPANQGVPGVSVLACAIDASMMNAPSISQT